MALAGARRLAHAQPAPQLSDAAKDVVGAWEISNSDRDKRCAVTFSADAAPGGFKLELDPACGDRIPAAQGRRGLGLGPNDVLRLIDAKGAAVFEFTEVESGIYEGERKGEGLYFMQTQAALKAEIRTAEQMFGDWKFLRELDKPLCTLTLSNAARRRQTTSWSSSPAATPQSPVSGLTTWQLDRDQLVLTGRGGTWRFSESDPTLWERIPLSTNPLLLMRP